MSNTGLYNGAFQMLKMGVGRLLALPMCRKNVAQPRQASPEADARGLVPAPYSGYHLHHPTAANPRQPSPCWPGAPLPRGSARLAWEI
jgi:hypothetical protein